MSTSPRRSRKSTGRNYKERRLRVRSELRKNPDIAKIGNAVIALALAQAEKEAEEQRRLAEHATGTNTGTDTEQPEDSEKSEQPNA